MKRIRILTFLLGTVLTFSSAKADDIQIFTQRLHNDLIKRTDTSMASAWRSQQATNGSWSDVNYADRDRSRWLPIIHLRRTRAIAAAYYTPSHALYGSDAALTSVKRGLEYWYGRNSRSDNWWHQEVNTPQQLGAILLICKQDLTPAILTEGANDLRAAKNLRSDTYWSAQNTIYTSFSRIYLAALENNLTELVKQLNRVKAEAAVKTGLGRTGVTNNNSKEGIRIEGSFYQHGPALYNGFYGAHYATDMPFWIVMTEGLSFGFSTTQKEVIQDYLLDSQQWMNRYGILDPNSVNRKISHDNYDYVTLRYHDPIVYGLEYLRTLGLPRATELEAFYQHMTAGAESAISGNRSFFKTDFMVQAGSGYQVSTKLWSYHNEGTEYINGDGRQGQFLSLGGTFLQMDGTQYEGIFPVWDWGHVPGTTTLHRDPANPPNGSLGTQKFAGGISNGSQGGMAYDHNYDSVAAKKSWFYFDEAYVMLGAGITGGNGSLGVNTTVEQSFLKGSVTYASSAGQSALQTGTATLNNPSWLHHGNVGYLFPGQQSVKVSAKSQSGSWYEINDSFPTTTLTYDVFSLFFDHGLNPVAENYACIVAPAMNPAEFAAYRQVSPISVISNTASLQAVYHSSLQQIQATFHAAGTLTAPDGTLFEVTAPCMVMIDQTVVPNRIIVADPTEELAALTVKRTPPGQPKQDLLFNLPQGDRAGSSSMGISDPPPAPTPRPPKIAATLSATSSESSSGQASFVVDGILNDDSKRWATSNGYPQWIELDLGSDTIVKGIEVFPYLQRAYQYYVEVRTETGSWVEVVDRRNNASGTSLYDQIPDIAGRFVRVTVTGATNYSGSWISLYEIELYGEGAPPVEDPPVEDPPVEDPPVEDPPVEDPPESTWQQLTVSDYSSQQAPALATNLVDGITIDDNRWSAKGFPQWIELDLGSNKMITDLEISAFRGRAYQFVVEARTESGIYSEILDRTDNTTGGLILSQFSGVSARYVRITFTGASNYTGSWVSIQEIRISAASGEIPTPPTTETWQSLSVSNWSDESIAGSAQYLADGITDDDSLRWASNKGYPQWVELDLGSDKNIRRIEMTPFLQRAYQYRVETRLESGTYFQILDQTSNTTGGLLESQFSNITGRYLRITFTGASGYSGSWVSLHEIRVATESAASPPTAMAQMKVPQQDQSSLKANPSQLLAEQEQKQEQVLPKVLAFPSDSSDLVITMSPLPNNLVLVTATYTKEDGLLDYRLEISSDLVDWNSEGVSIEEVDPSTGKFVQTFQGPAPASCFARMRMSVGSVE